MARLSSVLRSASGTDGKYLLFWCPGCDSCHQVRVIGPEAAWTYNGNPEKPTFQPSILVTGPHAPKVCHSYVTDGRIMFLADCDHELKGQTVDLPAWDFEFGGTEEP